MMFWYLTRASERQKQRPGVNSARFDPRFEGCDGAQWTSQHARDFYFPPFPFLVRLRAAQLEAHKRREEPDLTKVEAREFRRAPACCKSYEEQSPVAPVYRRVAEEGDGSAELVRGQWLFGTRLLIVFPGRSRERAAHESGNRMVEVQRAVLVAYRRANVFEVIKSVTWLTLLDAPGDKKGNAVWGGGERLTSRVVAPPLENTPGNSVAALGVLRLGVPHQIFSRGAQFGQIYHCIEQRELLPHCNLLVKCSTDEHRHLTTLHLTIVKWE